MDIYLIDTRDKIHNYRKDPTVPFDKFYVVPEAALPHVQRMTPYALVLPLTKHYQPCLEKKGLDVPKLLEQQYQVVVPIHMTRVKGKRGVVSADEVQPSFMSRRKWWRKNTKLGNFIPEDVTMITPTGELSPMCASCEWSLHHMGGECTVGTEDCLKHLKIRYTQLDEDKLDKEEKGASKR